jgi:hypothetical protein
MGMLSAEEVFSSMRGLNIRRAEFADLQSAGSIWPKEDSLQNEESGFTGESSA